MDGRKTSTGSQRVSLNQASAEVHGRRKEKKRQRKGQREREREKKKETHIVTEKEREKWWRQRGNCR